MNEALRPKFLDLKEGACVISLKPFVSAVNARVTKRNVCFVVPHRGMVISHTAFRLMTLVPSLTLRRRYTTREVYHGVAVGVITTFIESTGKDMPKSKNALRASMARPPGVLALASD